jgi:hypothetical protein
MTDTNLVNNQVVASSNSQYVSIVAENGEQFNPRQKIIFNIEPEIGFIKKDSYIVFDLLNNSADKGRYTLQKNLGASAIIDRVDIYSKETGILLESNTNYCEWLNVMNQYMYDDTTNLVNHQGCGTPIQSWSHNVNTGGNVSSFRSIPSPRHIENNQLSPVSSVDTNGGLAKYTTRRFCVPLMCGLFGAYEGGMEKAIPVMNFGGLRIEITLNAPKIALQPLGWSYVDTRQTYNAKESENLEDWVSGSTVDDDNATDQSGTANACVFKFTAGTSTGYRKNNLQDVGLVVGNKMTWSGTDSTDAAKTYTGTVSAIANTVDRDLTIDGKVITHSSLMSITLSGGGAGINGVKTGKLKRVPDDCNYKVSNVEFRLKQIVPPDGVADSLMRGINYEYMGYEVFMNNIPTGSLRHQIPINSVASKSVATFTILHDTSNGEGETHSSADMYNGILPNVANLNEVVYFINNRLYPLRAYNPQNKGDRVLATNELVKSFRALGVQPANLGNADFCDLENYTNTPLISRELAREGMVFDLRNAEPELRLSFSASRSHILRANTFVFSKKIIQTTATGLQVIH